MLLCVLYNDIILYDHYHIEKSFQLSFLFVFVIVLKFP